MERRDGENTSDAAITAEILAKRDAMLSHIAHTLSKALADDQPTPPNLNSRHPDFAAFAVRIGRALGREQEAIAALQSAEQDKSMFCLENDNVATALMKHLQEVEGNKFAGTAEALRGQLSFHNDISLSSLSATKFGKRLSNLWPHLQKVLKTCTKVQNRTKTWEYSFAL
jgi:hypothetical protein